MEQYPKIYLYRRLVQAKFFIEEHFAEKIDLDNIADEAFFSKFHFIRLYKSVYNKTPHQYLTKVRIDKAKLLLEKDFSVSEVCYAVGFESLSSFTALFKKIIGITPSVFQQENLKRRIDVLTSPLKYIPGCFVTNTTSFKNSNFQEVI